MTEIRDQEHAVYETEHADATAAVSALSSAIGHIEGSKSLLEVKAEVRQGFGESILIFQIRGESQGNLWQVRTIVRTWETPREET